MSTRPTRPIRIAFCITELEPGGAERCLVELVERLDRRRFEPLVYCLGPRPPGNPDSLAERIERSGAAVHFFDARRNRQFPRVLLRLSRRLQADAPEILQCFLFHANVVGALAGRRARVPHVLSGIRVAERRGRWHLALARRSDRWVERHICVSQAVRDFSHLHGRLPAEKLLVIPNGVDLRRFSTATPCPTASLGLTLGRRAITYVGRLDPQKGLPWLMRLLPQIFARLPEHDLLLVGGGPQRADLERLADALGVADRVHFLGYRPDVPAILAASELLVLPSRWEGMPNVVLEAMAAGKPVVATDVEGVAEALGPGAVEQVVPLDDVAAFATAVCRILAGPDAARFGAQNRARVEQHFSVDAMVAAYERLYLSLVGAGR